MSAQDEKLRELVINRMTKAQYDAHILEASPNQFYVVEDETEGITAKDLLSFIEPSPDIVVDLNQTGDKIEIHFDEGATTARGFSSLSELGSFVYAQPNREYSGMLYVKAGSAAPTHFFNGWVACPNDPSAEGSALAVGGYAIVGNSLYIHATGSFFSVRFDGARISNAINLQAFLAKKRYRHCVTVKSQGFAICFEAISEINVPIDSYQDLSAVCAGKEYPATGTAMRIFVDGIITNDTLLFADGTEKKLSVYATGMTFHDDVTLVQ